MDLTARARAVEILARARKARSYVCDRYSPRRTNGCRPADIQDVLVIDSASRSGSSFLHYLISRHRDVISLNGEGSVFARLAGLGVPMTPDDSDLIAPGPAAGDGLLASVAEDMLRDAGLPHLAGGPNPFPTQDFLADCVQRLILQYAEVRSDPDRLHQTCAQVLERHTPRAEGFSAASYWRNLLETLRKGGFPASPAHYDLRGSDPAADFPDADNLLEPPFTDYALEDPPFVVPSPRALPSPGGLKGKVLLLKSSSDCYRMWMIRRMFPKARLRFVTLARNPAGAISGMIDGWHSNGFYSQNLGHIAGLDIAGYSRSDHPWTTRWWNFDLPPGWYDYRARPIAEVCGLQWLSANEHIQRDIKNKVVEEHLPMRYESFLERSSLAGQLARVFAFAGLDDARAGDGAPAPRVMSVTPPAPQKWRKRRDDLADLVSGGRIAEMARELGYDTKGWEDWP